ncbi:MAG: quinolinate synthase NadA [Candidatus Aenigmatarchaeota archaeon]
MKTEELIRKIKELKKAKNAIILVHNYQRPEIYEVADCIGDSLELALRAKKAKAKIIVFCGVDFMAESAKLLNPAKKVLIPDVEAKCPMAAMATAGKLRQKKTEYPRACVVAYINTNAATKAESDVCCTSANFKEAVEALSAHEVIFVPDYNMAKHVQSKTRKKIIPWPGFCIVHDAVDPKAVKKLKWRHPKAKVIAHPENPEDVLALADHVCGTGGMIKYAKTSKAKEFIVVTEEGMCERLRREVKGKKFFAAAGVCQNMKKTTLEKVYACLRDGTGEVLVDSAVAEKARRALDRMLKLK